MKRLKRIRARRGATMIESLLVIVLITFIFWCFFLVFDLAMMKVFANHSAYLMGRSHSVGFNNTISRRARNIGMIPVSGRAVNPNMNDQIRLGTSEPYMIEQYVQGYGVDGGGSLLNYEFWGLITGRSSDFDAEDEVRNFGVTMEVFSPDADAGDVSHLIISGEGNDPIGESQGHRINILPGLWSFTGSTFYQIHGNAKMLNHAGYYLNEN